MHVLLKVVEEERSIEAGLLQLKDQNDDSGCRITLCVILSTLVAVCGSFSFGVAMGYTSAAEIGIMKDWGLSIAQFSEFGSFNTLGSAIGALFSGKMAVLLGRRRTMWVSDILCIVGWFFVAFAKDVMWLNFGRISSGIGLGLISYVVGIGLMLVQQFSGSSAIISYASTIFRKAGFSVAVGSTLLGLFMIPKAMIGVILVDKWGRRPLLLTSASGMCITSILIGIAFTLQKIQLLPELTPIFTFICVTK